MKKTVLVFVVTALVLITTGIWYFSTNEPLKPFDLLTFGIIVMVVSFAVFLGFKRLTSAKRGEPAEDELSKKIMRKASSVSYYISLYLWLAIGYFSEKINYETHTIIGAGILGMAVIFLICWLVINFSGIRNE
jgi:peptidoglycan/LPS O-acetylase OafA/YrhL